jgi:transcription termination factor NusB
MGHHGTASCVALRGEVDPFARETAEAVVAEAADYDRRITEAAESWTADRLGAIERNILRIALYELDGERFRTKLQSTKRSIWQSGTQPTMLHGW